jgi:hypothetical protein
MYVCMCVYVRTHMCRDDRVNMYVCMYVRAYVYVGRTYLRIDPRLDSVHALMNIRERIIISK